MSSIVRTTDTCDVCGEAEERAGAEAGHPPVGWAALEFTRRDKGSGWTNNTHLFRGSLCAECQKAVLKVLRP